MAPTGALEEAMLSVRYFPQLMSSSSKIKGSKSFLVRVLQERAQRESSERELKRDSSRERIQELKQRSSREGAQATELK